MQFTGDLGPEVETVLRTTPTLILETGMNLFTGEPYIAVMTPGRTERSKPKLALPLLFGPDGNRTHSSILRTLADCLEAVGR